MFLFQNGTLVLISDFWASALVIDGVSFVIDSIQAGFSSRRRLDPCSWDAEDSAVDPAYSAVDPADSAVMEG